MLLKTERNSTTRCETRNRGKRVLFCTEEPKAVSLVVNKPGENKLKSRPTMKSFPASSNRKQAIGVTSDLKIKPCAYSGVDAAAILRMRSHMFGMCVVQASIWLLGLWLVNFTFCPSVLLLPDTRERRLTAVCLFVADSCAYISEMCYTRIALTECANFRLVRQY